MRDSEDLSAMTCLALVGVTIDDDGGKAQYPDLWRVVVVGFGREIHRLGQLLTTTRPRCVSLTCACLPLPPSAFAFPFRQLFLRARTVFLVTPTDVSYGQCHR